METDNFGDFMTLVWLKLKSLSYSVHFHFTKVFNIDLSKCLCRKALVLESDLIWERAGLTNMLQAIAFSCKTR